MSAPGWLIPSSTLIASIPIRRVRTVADEMVGAVAKKESQRRRNRRWWFGAKGRAWREANRERIRARQRKARAANPERRRSQERAWRERNRERLNSVRKAYYYANYDKRRAYLNEKQREYRRKKKENGNRA